MWSSVVPVAFAILGIVLGGTWQSPRSIFDMNWFEVCSGNISLVSADWLSFFSLRFVLIKSATALADAFISTSCFV